MGRPPYDKGLPYMILESPLLPLLYDAIQFAREAEIESADPQLTRVLRLEAAVDRERRLSRASILLAGLLPETVESVALAALRHEGKSPLTNARPAKAPNGYKLGGFDKILSHYRAGVPGTLLPLTDPRYQSAQELMHARDELAHSVRIERPMESTPNGGFAPRSRGNRPHLDIPFASWDFRHQHAVRALQAASAFLSDFFIDQCGLDNRQSVQLLTTIYVFDRYNEWPQRNDALTSRPVAYAVASWGLDLRFVDAAKTYAADSY